MKTKILFLGIIGSLFFGCNSEEAKPEEKKVKETFTFKKITRELKGGKIITAQQVLEQIPDAKKKNYILKNVTISNTEIAEVSGKAPYFKIIIKKAGTFKITILLKKEGFLDTELKGDVEIILPILTFEKLIRKNSNKIIKKQHILSQIRGLSGLNYAIKSIAIPADKSEFAKVEGNKPNYEIHMLKVGSFTADIVLEQIGFLDMEIKNCAFQMIEPGVVRFDELTITNGNAIISKEQILGQIQELTGLAEYTLKKIEIPADKSQFAAVEGNKPNFSIKIKKEGSFTAEITLEKTGFLDVKIENCAFKILKPTLTFQRLTSNQGQNLLNTQKILNQVGGPNKTGYKIKSIVIPADKSEFAAVEGNKPNFSIKIKKEGGFTAEITLEKTGFLDVKIENCAFEILKPTLTFETFTTKDNDKAFFNIQELLSNVRGNKQGYKIKSVTIPADKSEFAELQGNLPNQFIQFKKPQGFFTLNLVLGKDGFLDVNIDNCQFALVLTFQKLISNSGKAVFNAQDILAQVRGFKDGYTIKSLTIPNLSRVIIVEYSPTFSMTVKRAGEFRGNLVLQKNGSPDLRIIDCEFSVHNFSAFKFKKLVFKDDKTVFNTQEILAQIEGPKDGYTIKSIAVNNTHSSLARIEGNKPDFSIKLFKTGFDELNHQPYDYTEGNFTFTTNMVLELSGALDVHLNGCLFEMKAFFDFTYDEKNKNNWGKSLLEVQLSDGSLVMGGATNIHRDNLPNYQYYRLIKVDQNGNVIWAKNYRRKNGPQQWLAAMVKTSDGNLVLAGNTTEKWIDKRMDILLMKVNANDGSIIWEKMYGGDGEDSVKAILETKNGDMFVVGGIKKRGADKYGDDGKGGRDSRVLKINQNGDLLWDRTYGRTPYLEMLMAGALAEDGHLVCAGGRSSTKGSSSSNFWVLKIDKENGNIIWDKTHGVSIGYSGANAMVKTFDNNFVIAGSSQWVRSGVLNRSADAKVMKINKDNGSIIWEKTYDGDTDTDTARSIIQTSDGNLVFAGFTKRVIPYEFRKDGFIVKINENDGGLIWKKMYGGFYYQEFNSIIQTKDGNLTALGNTTLNWHRDYTDPWLVKVSASDGAIIKLP